MKLLVTMFLIVGFGGILFAQTEPQRYQYHIWGAVTDENSKPMFRVTVCLIPAVRPWQGRFSCSQTDDMGEYAFTAKDIPDKYFVIAGTGKFPVFLADKNIRTVSTQDLDFGAADECRHINLQFKSK